MLAGFPMKFLHFKQFVDHMNVEYGNGLSLIVVTHAVASLSTRLRHSKVKVLGNGHLAMSSTEKTKKTSLAKTPCVLGEAPQTFWYFCNVGSQQEFKGYFFEIPDISLVGGILTPLKNDGVRQLG